MKGQTRYKRYVLNKWAKTKALLHDKEISAYVPQTKKLSPRSLQEMLLLHKMAYVKPCVGSFGNGVVRVELDESASKPYQYQHGLEQERFETLDELWSSLREVTEGRSYIVQQGIQLLKYRNKRFDIRVMVQKNEEGRWETTGIIGRVADPRKVVTNVHNGGTLVPAEELMDSYLTEAGVSKFLQLMTAIGVHTGNTLTKRYPGLKEIGIDVAVDQDLRPWILEVNTAPDPYIFRKLRNKNVYRKVYGYWKKHRPRPKLKPISKRVGLDAAKEAN